MPIVVKYFISTLVNQPGCRMMSSVNRDVGGERQQEPVVRVVLAVRRHDGIDGNDQRLEPVVLCPIDQLVRQLALLPDVELEPQPDAYLASCRRSSPSRSSRRSPA